jgi:type II secretory pathway pseudopilin PulG
MTSRRRWARTPKTICRRSLDADKARREAGDTLIEVLIALVIISIAVTGLMGALITSITTSGEHRSLTVEDTVLRSYAESYENQIQYQSSPDFRECWTEPQYQDVLVSPPTPPSYPMTVTFTVQYWNKNGSAFDDTCGPNDMTGVQLITLRASGSGATQTLSFVVRNPNDAPSE